MNTSEIVIPTVILSVDRLVRYRLSVNIPEWAVTWVFPKSQSEFRPKIDLGRIVNFAEYFGDEGMVPGRIFFETIMRENLIRQCLNMSDGVSVAAYRHCHSIFKGARVFLWQSVVYDNYRNLFVPWIQNVRDQMPIIYWLFLEYSFTPGYEIDVDQSLGLLI